MKPSETTAPSGARQSLSRQIVLLLLACTIFPMMALTLFFYLTETSMHRKQVLQLQSEVAERVARVVLLQIQGNLNSLRLLTLSSDLVDLDLPKIRRTFSSILFHQSEFDTLAVARADGQPLLRLSRLHTYREDEQEWLAVEPAFQQAREGKIGLGRVQISPFTRFPHQRLYVPVRERSDRVIAVLCADMNISQMWRLVAKSFTGKDFSSYIVDKDGILIAADDLSAVLERRELKELESVKRFFSGERGVFEYRGLEHTRVVGTVVEVPLSGWAVVVETDIEKAYSHIDDLWWLLGSASLGMIVLAGLSGWIFGRRRILGPVRALQKDVQIIAEGDLSHPITLDHSDELGMLAADLSTMTEKIRTVTVSKGILEMEILERLKAEEILKENERRLADILNFLPDATLAIDKEKRIIIWNRAIQQMTGIPPEEMIGKGDYAYTVPFYGVRRPQLMDLVWENREEISIKYPSIKQDGQSFVAEVFCPSLYQGKGAWVFAKAAPLHDQEGHIIGAIESIRDITENKKAEEEKEKLQAQLLQAQKMEAVGRLAGGIAHDFNNALQGIVGYVDLALIKTPADSPVHAMLRNIGSCAQRSADLVRQLLAFARRQTIHPRTLDVNATVTGMFDMLKRLMGEDVDLEWVPKGDLWPVKIDPSQLDQILANLCLNARDAISGVGKITIRTDNVSFSEAHCALHTGFLPGDHVLLAVRDNGCGMTREVLDNIFEPFFTTKAMGRGTGLGLAIVYGIVKQNNGFIDVHSEPGRGTTVSIHLPRSTARPLSEEGLHEVMEDQGGTETILLVEDEESILSTEKMILEHHGYKVLSSHSPSEALQIAHDHGGSIHLLITDVVMPEMNGKDLRESLNITHPAMKCIFMSGYTANVIAHHGVLDEGIHFLQKPFSAKELIRKVRLVLGA